MRSLQKINDETQRSEKAEELKDEITQTIQNTKFQGQKVFGVRFKDSQGNIVLEKIKLDTSLINEDKQDLESFNQELKDLQKDEEFGEVIDFLSTFKLTKDSIIHYAHNEQIDIFNRSRKPGGHNPEIGKHFGKLMNEFRKQYYDVIGAKGSSYMPLKVKGDDRDDVIAYARHNHGKTLVVVMNKNVHSGHRVKVIVPGLKASQILTDLSPEYGQKSVWKAENGAIDMELGMARGHIFEIDDPNIEQLVLESGGKVYKQNM